MSEFAYGATNDNHTTAPLTIHGTWSAPPGDRVEARPRPSQQGLRLPPWEPTRAALSGFRQPCVGWWGSSRRLDA